MNGVERSRGDYAFGSAGPAHSAIAEADLTVAE
jgi:hypothetical protein